jgi:TP901 family phage tail tape measure protein
MAGGSMNVRLFLDLVNRVSGPAKAAQKDLKGVGAAAKDLKKERGGEQIAKDMAKTQQAAKGAGSGLKEVTTAARSLKGERVGDQLAKDLERATKAAARAARELKAMKAAMREMAKTTALVNMAPALAGAGRKKKHQAGAEGGAAAGGFSSTAKGAAVAGALGAGRRALVPVAAGVGAYGAVRGTVGESVSREKALTDVKIKLDGMDDPKQFEAMKRQISEAAIANGRSYEEIARLVAEGGASGIQTGDMPEFLKLATAAAAAWDQPADKVANSLAKIKAQTGATLPQLREFGDLVNALSDAGAAKEMDVVDMFKRAGAAAKASGLDMKTTLAALTAMNNVGMEPEIASRGFAAMAGRFSQATEQGKDFQEGLKSLGLNAKKLEKDMKVNAAKTLVDVLERLEKSGDKGKAAIKLMGKEWWDEFLRLGQALPELKKNLAIVNNPKAFAGSMDKSLEIRLQTTATHLERLKVLAGEVGDRLGQWALPHINDGVQKLVDLLKEVDRRSADKKTIEDTAEKLATDKELSPDERRRMAEDGEYKKGLA